MSLQESTRSKGLNTPADFWGLVDLVNNLPAAKETLADIRAAVAELDDKRNALRVETEATAAAVRDSSQRLVDLQKRETAIAVREAAFVENERIRMAELDQQRTEAAGIIGHNQRLAADLAERETALQTKTAETEAALADRAAALDAREAELNAFAEQSEGLRRTLSALS